MREPRRGRRETVDYSRRGPRAIIRRRLPNRAFGRSIEAKPLPSSKWGEQSEYAKAR